MSLLSLPKDLDSPLLKSERHFAHRARNQSFLVAAALDDDPTTQKSNVFFLSNLRMHVQSSADYEIVLVVKTLDLINRDRSAKLERATVKATPRYASFVSRRENSRSEDPLSLRGCRNAGYFRPKVCQELSSSFREARSRTFMDDDSWRTTKETLKNSVLPFASHKLLPIREGSARLDFLDRISFLSNAFKSYLNAYKAYYIKGA